MIQSNKINLQKPIQNKEIYAFPDKESKINVLKRFNDTQEITDVQLNEIRKTILEQNKDINKDIDATKKEPNNNGRAETYNNSKTGIFFYYIRGAKQKNNGENRKRPKEIMRPQKS